jgi:hypothetical protein
VAGGVVEVVEFMLSNFEALSSNYSTIKRKKKQAKRMNEKGEGRWIDKLLLA